MTVARISMADFDSEESADIFEERYRLVAPPALPEAHSLTMIRTGPTSVMSVALYPDIETANGTLEARKEMLEEFMDTVKDLWHMEGSVSLHHINSWVWKWWTQMREYPAEDSLRPVISQTFAGWAKSLPRSKGAFLSFFMR